ncbi:MAG: hypothetical protein KAS97_05325 [Candidatus Aminicenantes bacterium]|nr:hypothetical protein [Candidatus Aminicenantes bacterium]
MASREDIFKDYIRAEHPGEDFEDSVFRKIKKKKRQRTVIVSTLGTFLLGGFLFISGTLFFPGNSDPLFTKAENGIREDVTITDYVTFAASDESNNYVIEQVGNFEESGTI